MDVHIRFAFTVANLAFGRSLWIEAVVKPLAEYSPGDNVIVVFAAVEVVALLTVSFTVGVSVVQIRVVVLNNQVAHRYALLFWLFVVTAVAGAAAVGVGCLIATDLEDDYPPT